MINFAQCLVSLLSITRYEALVVLKPINTSGIKTLAVMKPTVYYLRTPTVSEEGSYLTRDD